MLKSSGMEKLKKVNEKALYERMKTQIIQSSTRTPVKKNGKPIAKESEPEEHQNSLGLEGDITADHTNTKKNARPRISPTRRKRTTGT